MKRIAVDLAKSFYPVAERVRCGQMVQRKRLNREAFTRYIQERAEPVEWVVESMAQCMTGADGPARLIANTCRSWLFWGQMAAKLSLR